tara:strand:- start:18108 stop:23756 length:5649 start_codon:yes stop_codon:yes gene_type:complete
MTNYTDQLKNYWKSKDLTFIAKFKRVNKNAGFFNHFTNPISKMILYYPKFNGVEVLDKRVSFYYGNNSSLIDGAFYKVELEHTDNPKGKNNPYSLEIKSILELNQNKVEKLLSKENQEASTDEKYFGAYNKTSESFACFDNVMLADSGEILMFKGESQKVFVSPNIELSEDGYYSFSIVENEGKLPNAIPNTIDRLDLNPYQDFIRLRFERLNNPEANKMIANLMREIGKGMYSSKQRMIFELLQNADDAPGKEKVEFHIDINGDYFFIMHDGAAFNKDDVEAITSAAESTKRGDNKKTGYKGIGFKSVFTDSTEVWLKSGGYQFAFLRNCTLFQNFDDFYFSSKRYKDHPEFVEEDKLKFRNQRLRFNGATDIPWQVIPIWQDNLPNEFSDSNFNNFNNPVQFALKLGENNIEDYKTAIDNITKRPQFLLFLRNTSKFNARRNGVMVLRKDKNEVIEILKIKGEEKKEYYYTKRTFENIEVSDAAFEMLNIGLKKQSKINDYNEVTYYFTDLEDREIETIPPKLASASETEISFGISLIDNKISPEKEYIKGLPKYSSLFTYLPMEDTRFQLPFLVNADFVPSSDRQRIQGDNLWNKYIMIKVAEKHAETLGFYAKEFAKDNSVNRTYLSLLLKSLLPEDDTAQQIIDSYNEYYLEQLKTQNLVVNDSSETQLLSETILDNSGLIEIFGNDIFYEIIVTDKKLPHSNLDISYLKNYTYLEIEIIDLEELAKKINPEICERLGVIIAEKSLYEKPALLQWLNKLVSYIPKDFGSIPFIVHNNAFFSLERLIAEDDAWLINENTSDYQELIKELGYHTVNLNLDKYSNIKEYLHDFRGYINDKTLAYQRIDVNPKLSKLPTTSKLKLIDFLQNSDFMVGIGPGNYFGKLELFVDENRNARPLQQLISRQEAIEVDSILQFRIVENEFISLTEVLQKELIAKGEVFTSFILNTDLFNEWSLKFNTENIKTYVNDLKSIYTWVYNTDEISSADWASIPWLYIDDETKFTTSDKVYWSNAFYKLSSENFESIKAILNNTKIKTLPLKVCSELIRTFKLKTDNNSGIIWTEINNLEVLSANTLLDWMENDGTFSDFFKEYTLKANENELYDISKIEEIQIFDGSDTELTAYIQSNENFTPLFSELDKRLCSENRYKIGVLQGDKLLKAIIDSGSYDQNLAVHLPSKIDWQLLDSFISNLQSFNLKTGIEYGSNCPENIIVYNLLKTVDDINEIPEEVINLINNLRAKIEVNEEPLTSFDTSNTISFGKGKIAKGLSLSDVLNEYEGESDVLEDLLRSFVAISDKRKLRKFIFKNRLLDPQEIHYKIEKETGTFYSVYQVAFQLLDKSHGNNRNWLKQRFDTYYLSKKDENLLEISYQLFLDILIELPLNELSDFKFHNLVLNNCVDKNLAIESEVIPEWLEEWVNKDQENRLAFISGLGYNGIDSAIVKLRKAAINENFDAVSVIGHFAEAKQNPQMTWNTIKWLSSYSSSIITQNAELIKQINNSTTLSSNNLSSIIIPVIDSINIEGVRMYDLKNIACKSQMYLLLQNEKFDTSIFKAIKEENQNSVLIDDTCGKMTTHFKVETIKLSEVINQVLLQEKSNPWDEPFYKKWEFYSECPIYIYDGSEMPFIRTFNDIIINKTTGGLMEEYNGSYYFSKILKDSILNQKPSILPENKLQSLKDWYLLADKNPELIEDDPLKEKYNETFDRMLQDRYGISEERQNEENNNAKKRALYYLKGEGYIVDEGNSKDQYAALYDIKNSDGKNVNFIVRSAKGGLLYLDKEHWDMLESTDMGLIVIYPGNEPKLFKNRLDLLSDELAEKILFRIPNNRNVTELDGVFESLQSESHIILVTSEKMKESLFSNLTKNNTFNKEEKGAVGGDDFKL